MSRRQLLAGIAILVLVQALAITLFVVMRRGGEEPPFAAETLAERPAPDLLFVRGDGSRSSLAALRGKVVLVHFWATWCEPCRDELPGLLALTGSLAGADFAAIAVAVDDDWDAMTRFFSGGLPDVVVRPEAADVHRRFGVSTLPDTYLVNARGDLVVRYAGARDWTRDNARRDLLTLVHTHRATQ